MTTDTTERGLERLICTALAGRPCDPPVKDAVAEASAGYGGVGWICGSARDYDREYCVDLSQLSAFLLSTQPEAAESLALDEDGPTRRKFLARLQGEISKRGAIDVLRHGIRHGPHCLDIFYGTPSPGNEKAKALFDQNRFTVTRQLRYSRDESQLALDMALFVNGLPVFTFELKNSLTKQTVDDAVWQYKKDRNPREKLFEFGRCVAHFAVDENEVRFCTHLKGKDSWFLPFNRGWNDGAGNPPNPPRNQDRLLVARCADTGEPDEHPRELRPGGGFQGREDGQEKARPDLAPLSPARRRAQAPFRRGLARPGQALPYPALGGQRQVQFHRLAGPSVDRACQGRHTYLRFGHRGHRPPHPRQADLRHDQVLAQGKIGGKARAMVVTNGIERAIQYYHAILDYLKERKSKVEALVAFSGEYEYGGTKVNEASLNGFPSSRIAARFREEPYRFLVCADKFQTGYDEPLLHTMYVDKTLSRIKAVQTLSRLNRAHPQKHDVFVLDFLNDSDTIREAFSQFYRATILADETDPNKLHDLQADLDGAQVYSREQIDDFVRLYLGGAERDRLESHPRRLRGELPRRPRRRRPGEFQGQGQSLRAHLRVSLLGIAICKRRLGKALDLFELPAPQAARAAGGGPVQGYPRRHRHGQLPGGKKGDAEDHSVGRGRRDRAGAHHRGRRCPRPRAGQAFQHHHGVQRALRRYPLGGRRPGAPARHRGPSPPAWPQTLPIKTPS